MGHESHPFHWKLRHKLAILVAALDCAWLITWFVFVFLYQLSSSTTDVYRVAFFFLAFHTANLAALLVAVERFGKKPYLVLLALFFGVLGTDINSLMEVVLHLPSGDVFWTPQLALSIVALTISSITFLWYCYLLLVDRWGVVRVVRMRKMSRV